MMKTSPSPHEVLDGLLLGGAWWKSTKQITTHKRQRPLWAAALHEAQLRATARELENLRERWRYKQIPVDVPLSPKTLALFYLGCGSMKGGGYGVRFTMRRFERESVEQFAARLTAKYGWRPLLVEDRGLVMVLSRPGDRSAFAALIAPHLPAGLCAPRPPTRRLSPKDYEAIRASARSQKELSRAYGVSQAHISRIQNRTRGSC